MLVRFLANRWGFTEFVVWDETNSIDFYNILKYTGSGMTGNEYTSPRSKAGTSFNIDREYGRKYYFCVGNLSDFKVFLSDFRLFLMDFLV